jgi:hypothetical protein
MADLAGWAGLAGPAGRIGVLAVLCLGGLGPAACATASRPATVAMPGGDPFAIDEATDAPRVGTPAPGTRGGADGGGIYRFGADEKPMRAAGRAIFAGDADGAAYLYTADHRLGLMAGKPGQGVETLSYSGRDWYVTCPAGGGTCVVKVATAEVAGRDIQDAVRLLVDPAGASPVRFCLGPEGTKDGTVRIISTRRDYAAGSNGCLPSGAAARVMTALREGEDFQYRYTDASGADVRGWHPAWGLPQALALARWLGTRPAA